MRAGGVILLGQQSAVFTTATNKHWAQSELVVGRSGQRQTPPPWRWSRPRSAPSKSLQPSGGGHDRVRGSRVIKGGMNNQMNVREDVTATGERKSTEDR